MNCVDLPRTSADERDVVCSPRCRDCVWAVQGLVVFNIDLSLLREQSIGLGFLCARLLQLFCTAVFPPIFLQLRKGPL